MLLTDQVPVLKRRFVPLVARTKRLAITAKPPITTKRAPARTIAPAATSSSGSRGEAITPVYRAQKPSGLRGEVLPAAQQLSDRSVRWGRQGRPLFGPEPVPFGLVARLEQRVRRVTHIADSTLSKNAYELPIGGSASRRASVRPT